MTHTLRIIWAALLMGVLMFAGVAWFMGPQVRAPSLDPVVPWVLFGAALFAVVMSRVMPRIAQGPAQSKAMVGLAMAEGACLVSCVGWMISGHVASAAGLALGLVALVSLYPRDPKETETVKLMP